MKVSTFIRARPRARSLLATGALALVALTACSGSLATSSSGPADGQEDVVAVFDDASPLVLGSDVKVNGVVVGKVQNMVVVNNAANVTLRLERFALPIHRDARAMVKPVSLLGERYVDIDRGSPAAPVLQPGEIIPMQQTGQAVDLDQIFNTVDQPTGQALAGLITLLGHGLQNNGANTDQMIGVIESAMHDTDGLARVLSDQNKLLTNLADHFDPVASALAADEGRAMDRLVGSTNDVLSATAQNQSAFDAILAELPSTLKDARQTLGELSGTAQATTPLLRDIRPTTDNLVAIGEEIRMFSESADPALASTRPVLDRANELLDEARPVAENLRRAGPNLRGTAHGAEPITKELLGNIDNVLNFLRGWSLATNGWDGLSHYFRGLAVIDPDEVSGILSRAGVPFKLPGKGPAHVPLTQPQPRLPDAPGLLLGPGTPSSDGGVTGLSKEQENGAFHSLLGGS